MEYIKAVLVICELVFTVIFLYLIFSSAIVVFKIVSNKFFGKNFSSEFYFDTVKGVKHSVSGKRFAIILIVTAIAFLLGGFDFCMKTFFAKSEIGAFYEKTCYTQQYDVEIRPIEGKDPTQRAIATIYTDTDDDYGRTYYLEKLEFADGISVELCDQELEIDKRINFCDAEGGSWQLYLNFPIKDYNTKDYSLQLLNFGGEFCFSRKSDVIHYSNCKYVRQIHLENRIYTNSYSYANLLQLKQCEICEQ